MTVVAGLLITFPYYAAAFYLKTRQTQIVANDKSNIKQAEFKIKGMSYEGCTEHVNSEVAKIKGVINFQTSSEKTNSIVKFDSNKTSVDSIAAAINSTGYKVTPQKKQLMDKAITLQSVITCPVCKHRQEETMPTDACQYFYECKNCKTRLKPKEGDCCVFCSYGSVKCPPIQMRSSCCS